MSNNLYSQVVLDQKKALPEMYARIDFKSLPERFAGEADDISSLTGRLLKRRPDLLANKERIALIRDYTMMGDSVSDAYVYRLPEFGFRKIVDMLDTACEHGIEAVEDAPPELVAFLADMERIPDWLDMDLINRGAEVERNSYAHFAPFVTRGALFATFMNKYSALPMAMTGTFSGPTSAKRVLETATFFTTTVMPGALERFGAGFKSAAKVRLMHSMVRIHSLRTGKWDVEKYGLPIPQVDQMPAGILSAYLVALAVLKEGRSEFTRDERAKVEIARYRSFLLGLPEDLLGDTPQSIVDLMETRQATLRKGWDEDTCGSLVKATMEADLFQPTTLWGKMKKRMEQSFAKFFFVKVFCNGRYDRAEGYGVTVTNMDRLLSVATGLLIFTSTKLFDVGASFAPTRKFTNKVLVRKLERLLESYGGADFVSNSENYKSTAAAE